MKAITKYLMMAAASLLLTTACSNEYDESPAPAKQGKPVQFDMTLAGVNSRTVTGTDAGRTTTWVEGDAVGIFAYKRGDTTPTAINAKYVLQGDKWVAEGTGVFAEESQLYDYYAYYPYTEGVVDPAAVSLASLADQTTADGTNYGLSDVMGSQNKTVAADAVTIPLVFKHLFAMVEVQVVGDPDLLTKQPASVVLKGVKLGATLNLLGNAPVATVNADEVGTDVTMYYLAKAADNDKAPFAYRAVVPAQTIAAKTPLVAVNGVNGAGKSYELQFSTAVEYLAGKFRKVSVMIGAPKVSIEIPKGDITIDPWEPSDPIEGEGSEVPVTSITLPIATDMAFTGMEAWTTTGNKLSGDTDFWFHREKQADGEHTVITIEADGEERIIKAMNTSSTIRGAWNNSSFGYHTVGLYEKDAVYVLTFKLKTATPSVGMVGLTIRNSADDMSFQILKGNISQGSWERSATTVKATENWGEATVNINFAKKSSKTAAASVTEADFSDSTSDDVKGINFYFYSDTVNTGILIKDIKLEKYVAPAP